MNRVTRNYINHLDEQLRSQVKDIDYTNTFNTVFIRAVAQTIIENTYINYVQALNIATNIKVEAEEIVESDEDIYAVESLGATFGLLLIDYTKSFFDDGGYDIEVMKNIASQMNVSVS